MKDPKEMQERLDEVGEDIEEARRDIEHRHPDKHAHSLYGDDDETDIDDVRPDMDDPGISTA